MLGLLGGRSSEPEPATKSVDAVIIVEPELDTTEPGSEGLSSGRGGKGSRGSRDGRGGKGSRGRGGRGGKGASDESGGPEAEVLGSTAHEEAEGTPSPPYTPDCGLAQCKNFCGWTAYTGKPTCCTRCRGPYGPHTRDCSSKNKKVIRQKRKELLPPNERTREEDKTREAVKLLRATENGREMLELLQVVVEEVWLGGYSELTGNVYRAFALGSFPGPTCDTSVDEDWSIWKPHSMHCVRANGKFLGAMAIWLTQLIGPFVMLYELLMNFDDWKFMRVGDMSVSDFGNKLVALMLIIAFNLNAYWEVGQEWESWEKISAIFKTLHHSKFGHHTHVILRIGEMTNCYVFVMSCVCTTLLLGTAESTKDILFDALGILFLYNLDDVGGQLGFVSEVDWPGRRLAWLYDQIPDVETSKMSVSSQSPAWDRFDQWMYKATRGIISFLSCFLPCFFVIMNFGGDTEDS